MRKLIFLLALAFLLLFAITFSPASANPAAPVGVIVINGPPTPPGGPGMTRPVVELPEPDPALGVNTLTVPAYDWSFGCSATSGAMIAAYYDRNGYPELYTGPSNGGVMPLDSSIWPRWTDGAGKTYGQCPLTASHLGLDGRTTRGSIDDYWVSYNSAAQDPYLTGGWTQHTWGSAIGDYMKTSQSAYSNTDGSTTFYYLPGSAAQLTCAQMLANGWVRDGTLGRKSFYEARGYTVTDCYSQNTDNEVAGGFSYARYKAEIDAGRPVMINVQGHTMVGVGYSDPSTVYLHDTWDYATHSMPWGGSYEGMRMLSVSIVNLEQAVVNGVLSGVVRDASSAAPLNGASIVVSGGGSTTSGSDGAYSLELPGGDYSVTASAAGYLPQTLAVSITNGSTTIRDFSLTPVASLAFDPPSLQATLLRGGLATQSLTLSNNGAAPLNWQLQEQPGGYLAPDGPSLDLSWLSENPSEGSLAAFDSLVVEVAFDASAVAESGLYTATLHILSNDPALPDLSLPISMQVLEPGELLYLPLALRLDVASPETICNGDFEQGPTCWTEYSNHGWPLIIDSEFPEGVAPHSGDWLVWLGGAYDEISYIQQQVSVPAGSPYLAYFHWIASEDFCGYDFGGVFVNSTLVEVYDLCANTSTGGWVKRVVDLSDFTGQTITLQMRAEMDGLLNSNLFIDDVAFQSNPLAPQQLFTPLFDFGGLWAAERQSR